eukprot:CAMPEP_0201489510 /NCGR_PEP_ID=MMETSP0151_2-20130828/22847_1 /ASSEMBLY_ACC=CAM_ASM_000257 /TAXON_ID=200890 /ORGANISM="Paramoeba atlantica, Strain 621/1 / CCAP 1560/9" /LENGTH=126 /DNA_ID=CAMNT_0047875125 /DNA_START=586 /DNA_END=966 /DNA_ORIENTATION=-
MKQAAVFLCLLFVISMVSADKKFCITQYNDTNCETASDDPVCVDANECIKNSDTASTEHTCDGDNYTTTTYPNADCSANGTVIATGSLGDCVVDGQTSSKITCGAGQLVISAALVGFSVAFAFFKL